MDEKDSKKDAGAPKKDENLLETHLKQLKIEGSKETPTVPETAKESPLPATATPTAEPAESDKYLLNPAEPLKTETVRKWLAEILKNKNSHLVIDSYELDDERILAALPDAGSVYSVILIPILSNGHYFLFELQKSNNQLIVYNSHKDKVDSSDQLKRVLELLKKKGFGSPRVAKPELVQEEPNSKDSGVFIAIFAYFSIVKELQNYKVGNSQVIRTNMYDFLMTKDTKYLDQLLISEHVCKPITKMESLGFAAPLVPKTNITGTIILPPAKPAVPPTGPGFRIATVPTVSKVQVPLHVPPSPTQSASSEGSYSYSLPGSPSTPNGLMKYRRYLKKYRKMAREDDEGVQYVWTKYKIDEETIRRERRSFADNSRYPPRRGRRRMVLMEIDSEVTWNLMIRCKFCAETFSRAVDCKEHLIGHHNLERN